MKRFRWEKPGDMIHVNTKLLARFKRAGHRITATGQPPSRLFEGRWLRESVHMGLNNATHLAYVEVLADEQNATTVGFTASAVG
jgi:hypothetical protein